MGTRRFCVDSRRVYRSPTNERCVGLTHYLYAAVLPWNERAEPNCTVSGDALLDMLEQSRGKEREEMQSFYHSLGLHSDLVSIAMPVVMISHGLCGPRHRSRL